MGTVTAPAVSYPVLLVEDKDSLRAMLRHALEAQGHTVVEARDEPEAIRELQNSRPAVVLTDLKLPNGDGFGVLRAAKELDPELQVVVMTAYGSIQDAVTAMKEGAMDFLAKPVDPDHLLLMVERAISQRRMLTEYIILKEELAERRGAPRIIGEDRKLRQVSQQLHRAAATDATVLIEGESGTGKELFARALHALSPRADGPFVAINCAAIPENLLETELFGHEKGAFTGAVSKREGRFARADCGTLFLDEIGELSQAVQVKLLRVLQEGEYEPVGGETQKADVRIVTATNRDLAGEVAAGRFRGDLYYRLNVIALTAPPLRSRREDIPLLVDHFLTVYCKKNSKPRLAVARETLSKMAGYSWPGNVRELENVIERAVVLCRTDTLRLEDLPETITESEGSSDSTITFGVGTPLDEVERRLIRETLRHAKGDKSVAAQLLGISTRTIYRKLGEDEAPAGAKPSEVKPRED